VQPLAERASTPQVRVGLDIGGTKTAGGVVLLPEGEVLARRVMPTRPARRGMDVFRDTLDLAQRLIDMSTSMGYAVDGIGAGVAELVTSDGEIASADTIPWRGLPIRQQLSQLAPAVVESDVRAAAMAEAVYGAGREYSCFAYVTVGTGISYTLMQEGEPYRGARGNAIVLASGQTTHTCTHCGERSVMVLEHYASGPAIARRYAARAGHNAVTGEDVIRAAAASDPLAVDIVTSAGAALGQAVGFLVNLLDPAAVVVGGGLGSCGSHHYWQSFVESTRAHIWAEGNRDVPIVTAGLGPDAGFIGAALASWRHAAAAKETR
jgi:glucokinase